MNKNDFPFGVPIMFFTAFGSAFFVLWLMEFMANIFSIGYAQTARCCLSLPPQKADLYFKISAGWAVVCGAYTLIRDFRGNR